MAAWFPLHNYTIPSYNGVTLPTYGITMNNNLYVTPPLQFTLGGNITLDSGDFTDKKYNETFVQINLEDGCVKIHPNKIILDGNKKIVGLQFLNFLKESIGFTSATSRLNINNYIVITHDKPFNIEMGVGKEMNQDLYFLKKLLDKYKNLKAFW